MDMQGKNGSFNYANLADFEFPIVLSASHSFNELWQLNSIT
jgi:hypothetical protein